MSNWKLHQNPGAQQWSGIFQTFHFEYNFLRAQIGSHQPIPAECDIRGVLLARVQLDDKYDVCDADVLALGNTILAKAYADYGGVPGQLDMVEVGF